MTSLQEIIDAARALSPAERLRLVDAVWDDEHPENWPALSPEWLAEVRRRSAEFDAGRMKASPWEDVQARVRRKARLLVESLTGRGLVPEQKLSMMKMPSSM